MEQKSGFRNLVDVHSRCFMRLSIVHDSDSSSILERATRLKDLGLPTISSSPASPRQGSVPLLPNTQDLLPLLMALNSATEAAHRPRANISGTAR
jgi:hypothetical protein